MTLKLNPQGYYLMTAEGTNAKGEPVTERPQVLIPEMAAPFDGSAWVPYDVGGTPVPLDNTAPPAENGVHEAVRRLDAAQRQIDAFLRPDGTVQNFCPGACVFSDVPGVE